jgi:thioredoxin 1
MGSIKVTTEDFQEKVLDAEIPAMVDFYADWCRPCWTAAPVIEEIAEEYQGKLIVFKVDVDVDSELAVKYQVMSIPTMLFFKDGQEVERVIGFGGNLCPFAA